jgi:uncharacterized protein (DUF362 family)
MTENNDMQRRKFISLLGKSLVIGLGVTSEGCSRVLEWSSGEKQVSRKQMKESAPGAANKNLPKTEKAPKAKEYPDLVAIKGDDPEENVRQALEQFGGMGRFMKAGAKVVLKPNLLTGRKPEYAVTTNPLVVAAIVKICLEAGASDVIALDQPTSSASAAFEISGIADAVKQAGGKIKILTDRNFEDTLIPEGRILKQWPLVKDIFEADLFINMPIAKTHSLATLTLSMKNLMGIMGGSRSTMHVDFDQKIVDLNGLVRPHLVVLDAYRMLVRNGPTGGSLSDVKLAKTVVVGTNQVSVDAYGTTLFGMKPTDLPYLVKANEQGIGEINLENLDIIEKEI